MLSDSLAGTLRLPVAISLPSSVKEMAMSLVCSDISKQKTSWKGKAAWLLCPFAVILHCTLLSIDLSILQLASDTIAVNGLPDMLLIYEYDAGNLNLYSNFFLTVEFPDKYVTTFYINMRRSHLSRFYFSIR
jgi:hypothetical protein